MLTNNIKKMYKQVRLSHASVTNANTGIPITTISNNTVFLPANTSLSSPSVYSLVDTGYMQPLSFNTTHRVPTSDSIVMSNNTIFFEGEGMDDPTPDDYKMDDPMITFTGVSSSTVKAIQILSMGDVIYSDWKYTRNLTVKNNYQDSITIAGYSTLGDAMLYLDNTSTSSVRKTILMERVKFDNPITIASNETAIINISRYYEE